MFPQISLSNLDPHTRRVFYTTGGSRPQTFPMTQGATAYTSTYFATQTGVIPSAGTIAAIDAGYGQSNSTQISRSYSSFPTYDSSKNYCAAKSISGVTPYVVYGAQGTTGNVVCYDWVNGAQVSASVIGVPSTIQAYQKLFYIDGAYTSSYGTRFDYPGALWNQFDGGDNAMWRLYWDGVNKVYFEQTSATNSAATITSTVIARDSAERNVMPSNIQVNRIGSNWYISMDTILTGQTYNYRHLLTKIDAAGTQTDLNVLLKTSVTDIQYEYFTNCGKLWRTPLNETLASSVSLAYLNGSSFTPVSQTVPLTGSLFIYC